MERQGRGRIFGLCAAASLGLTSCSIIGSDANELKAAGSFNLLFPFDLLGLSSVFPELRIAFSGGLEWHNDQEMHQHELNKLRLQPSTPTAAIGDEVLQALRTLSSASDSSVLQPSR